MIYLDKIISIENVAFPIVHEWIMPPCASLVSSVEEDGIITARFSAQDAGCYDQEFKLKITDANNCELIHPISIENPCIDFSVTDNEIKLLSIFKHAVYVEGGDAPYSYTWIYDKDMFNRVDIGQPNLLILKQIVPLATINNYNVSVIITDNKGCRLTINDTFTINSPIAENASAPAPYCVETSSPKIGGGNNEIVTPPIELEVNSANDIDWDTIDFIQAYPNVAVVDILETAGNKAYIKITFDSSTAPGIYEFQYQVSDILGLVSNTATVTVTIPEEVCDVFDDGITILPFNYTFNCSDVYAGFVIEIDLNDFVYSDQEIDWDTFAFAALPNQTIVSNKELQTLYGNVTLSYDNMLRYEITNPPISALDIIRFRICDIDGNCAITQTNGDYVYNYNCINGPIANNDTYCAPCGFTTLTQDITINDQNIDPSTITILNYPAPDVGTLSIDSSGVITFVRGVNFNDSFTFSYTGEDENGTTSNAATVVIEEYCLSSTSGSNISICSTNANNVSLASLLINLQDNTGYWEFLGYAANETNLPGYATGTFKVLPSEIAHTYQPNVTISNYYDTYLSFSESVSGFYRFRYAIGQGTCSDGIEVIIQIIDVPEGGSTVSNICDNLGVITLSSQIPNLPTGGIWSFNGNPNPQGFDPVNGTFDTEFTGNYNFTYTVSTEGYYNDTCDILYNLNLIIGSVGEPGTNQQGTYCNNEIIDLLEEFENLNNPLEIDVDGDWDYVSGPSNISVNNITFSPGTDNIATGSALFDMNGITAGQYIFRYNTGSTSQCMSSALFTVNVLQTMSVELVHNNPPNQEDPGTYHVCNFESGTAVILVVADTTPDNGNYTYTWYIDGNEVPGETENTLTYIFYNTNSSIVENHTVSVTVQSTCNTDTDDKDIVLLPYVSAGDDSNLFLCTDDGMYDLSNSLNDVTLPGGATGYWEYMGNTIGSLIDLQSYGPGVFQFYYTVEFTHDGYTCSDTSKHTITIGQSTDSGEDTTIHICLLSDSYDDSNGGGVSAPVSDMLPDVIADDYNHAASLGVGIGEAFIASENNNMGATPGAIVIRLY